MLLAKFLDILKQRFDVVLVDAPPVSETMCSVTHRDESQDPEFLNFAVYNISELFGYIATGRVNIRICREDGPPPLLAFALTEPTFGKKAAGAGK